MTDILDLQIASPTFGGSTGGWLRAAETEEACEEACGEDFAFFAGVNLVVEDELLAGTVSLSSSIARISLLDVVSGFSSGSGVMPAITSNSVEFNSVESNSVVAADGCDGCEAWLTARRYSSFTFQSRNSPFLSGITTS